MDVHVLWEGRVLEYTNEVLIRGHGFEPIAAIRRVLAISVKDFRLLIVECAVDTGEQLLSSQILMTQHCIQFSVSLEPFPLSPLHFLQCTHRITSLGWLTIVPTALLASRVIITSSQRCDWKWLAVSPKI